MESDTKQFAVKLRRSVIQMSHSAGAAHLGSSLSCADIVAVLYSEILRFPGESISSPSRDRFIMSKGHAAAVMYSALAYRGLISQRDLVSYGQPGSSLGEHPLAGMVPGVEAATGSLGHGLSIGVGMALAGRVRAADSRVFVLTSDGENNEGSVWEAAMFAAAQRLERLCVVVDYNKWQATGRSDEVLALSPLLDKWKAFGWHALELDGHDHDALTQAFRSFESATGTPTAIVAHTVKGKGVSFMEDDNNWHYRVPSAAEVEAALQELDLS